MANFTETLYDGYSQTFRIERVYFEHKTEHQHLMIFHSANFGRVMVLDGIVQTTERDEFIYHEMLTHVPMFAHGAARRVLIVGGGDGAMLREVLKHSEVERVVQVEIDRAVIEMSQEYLPNHSQGAYEDPRLEIVIDDGQHYVSSTAERFDVIISDSTDPIGPGQSLFSSDFYQSCHDCLKEKGILVTQNGVAFLQPDEIRQTAARLDGLFADWSFYQAAIPTYVGGQMTFAWASDDPSLREPSLEQLQARFERAGIATRYYNPRVHLGSFALPQYVLGMIGKNT